MSHQTSHLGVLVIRPEVEMQSALSLLALIKPDEVQPRQAIRLRADLELLIRGMDHNPTKSRSPPLPQGHRIYRVNNYLLPFQGHPPSLDLPGLRRTGTQASLTGLNPSTFPPREATATRRFGTHQRSDSANPLVSVYGCGCCPRARRTRRIRAPMSTWTWASCRTAAARCAQLSAARAPDGGAGDSAGPAEVRVGPGVDVRLDTDPAHRWLRAALARVAEEVRRVVAAPERGRRSQHVSVPPVEDQLVGGTFAGADRTVDVPMRLGAGR